MSFKIIKELKIYQWVLIVISTLLFLIVSVYYFNSYKNSKIYNLDFSAFSEKTDSEGLTHLDLNGISLRKGSYSIAVGYNSPAVTNMTISLDNDVTISDTFDPTAGEILSRVYNFELKTGTDRGRLEFISDSYSPVSLAFITIASEKHIYNDGLIWGILALLMIPACWVVIWLFELSEHKISVIVTLLLVAVSCLPFILQRGLHMGIDTRAHMMRIEGIYYGLIDGQFPVVVQPEWNNSYGQIGVLYPNLFLYVPAVFRCLGMSQLGACKLYLFIVIIAGAAIAIGSARTIFKRDWQITLCVIVILMGNMRLSDMYYAGMIGGALLAEVFWPLVIAGLIEIFYHNKNKWYLLAYGVAGTFCCHIISSTIMCIMIVIFALCSVRKFKNPEITRRIGYAILLTIGLTFGTAVCFIKFFFSDWGQDALQWEDFCSTLWRISDPFSDKKWISVIVMALLCFASYIIIRLRKGQEPFKGKFVVAAMITATVLLWMSTAYFPWRLLIRIPVVNYYTNMLQSGFRFLSLSGCLYAFCLPELLERIVHLSQGRRSYESKTTIIVSLLVAALAIYNYSFENYRYFIDDEVKILYYDEVLGDLEYQYDDYLPAGTKNEWYATDTGYISNESAVNSLAYEREGTYIYYSYTNTDEGAYVEFPRFYYEGYVAEDEMAEPVPIVKGEHNRTRAYLKKTDTPAIIRMWYYVPWYLTASCAVSYGFWIASLMIVLARLRRKVKE